MINLSKVKIADIGLTITGKTPSSKNPEDFGVSETMFVTPSDSFDKKMMNSTERYLSIEGIRKLSNKLLPLNSLMVTCIGSAMGKVTMNPKRCITNQQINSIIPKDNHDSNYIYYALKNNYKLLRNAASGSTALPLLNKTDFDLLEIAIHNSKKSQQKIAYVLSALDAKIELNNRINAELEKMAKTIYDYWFVQFDFPDANGKPYKSSGGAMVWNEELKREIPEGWEVLQLSNKLTFEKGIEPGSAQYKEKKESINHIKFIRVGDIENYSSIFVDNSQKKYATVNEKDVLVTFDGSVGKVAFGFEGAYSGGLRKIYDKSGLIDSSLIYFIFKDERLIKTIHKYATGSILLHAGASINNLKISFNEKKYLEFQNIIKPFFYKMMINKKQNQTLAELRDWLLPMLMNGQIKVE